MLKKIISGGQTGVDRAAFVAAWAARPWPERLRSGLLHRANRHSRVHPLG